MADMRAHSSLARTHGLVVIEDACQAHGADRDGLGAGTAGLAGAFSFYPGKNLGAFGDAGALVTDDLELDARVRALARTRSAGEVPARRRGLDGALDTIQALVLLRKLPQLDAWNDDRRRAAELYSEALHGVGDLHLPPVPEGSRPVWHLYVVPRASEGPHVVPLRDGVATGRHYPEPAHLTAAYAGLGYRRGSFPVTDAWQRSWSPFRSSRACARRSSRPSSPRSGSSSAMLDRPANEAPFRLIEDVEFGHDVIVRSFTNLYGCLIGDESQVGTFVEIQRGVTIGSRCKIQSHTFICDGVEIADQVFVGHGVVFINDKVPRATTHDGSLKDVQDWRILRTVVERRASIGSGAVILGGVRIGAGALSAPAPW